MRDQTRTFLKEALTGAIFVLVYSWVFQDFVHWTAEAVLDREDLTTLERVQQ